MKKVFISQPMNGRSDNDILSERIRMLKVASAVLGEPVEEILSFSLGNYKGEPIKCLGEAIKLLSDADLVVFAPGSYNARGCMIERQVAESYGKRCIYIDDTDYKNEIKDAFEVRSDLTARTYVFVGDALKDILDKEKVTDELIEDTVNKVLYDVTTGDTFKDAIAFWVDEAKYKVLGEVK